MEKQLVKINRKVLKKEKEIDLNLDFIVPDIKPDIVAILDVNANTYIYKQEVSSERIRFDGNIDSKVLYLSDSGETRSLSVVLDFSETIDDSKISNDLRYYSSVELLNIEARIVNERKINVISKAKISVEFFEAKEIELLYSLDDFENVEIKEQKCNIKNFIGSNTAKASIKESLECDAMDNVLDILKSEIKIGKTENKVSLNKVLSKTDCEIKVVYQTEDMNVKVAKANYPIMSFIDLDKVQETHILENRIFLRNMQVFSPQNESNKIGLNIEFETILEAYENKEISMIEDIYSLNKIIEFTKKEFEAEIVTESIENSFSISERFDIQDINKIIDTNSTVRVLGKEYIGEFINYNLEVDVKVMYESDSRSGLFVKKFTFNTMIKVESKGEENLEIFIEKEEYTLNNDKVYLNLEIKSIVDKNSFRNISVLDDIFEKDSQEKPEYSMSIYFVKPKDTIWKIAKDFRVSMQSIIDNNNLENPDKINTGDRLYIVR